MAKRVARRRGSTAELSTLSPSPLAGEVLVDLTKKVPVISDGLTLYAALGEAAIVTTVGTPGSDTKVPSEQAVREAIASGGGGGSPSLDGGTAASTYGGTTSLDGGAA